MAKNTKNKGLPLLQTTFTHAIIALNMAFPVAAAITAGASLLGSGGQIYASGKMNKKTRKWNEKMYKVQREDALADWHLQNEYNSPQAQMQRFRDAGLNPNLIYGQSNEGGVVRSTDTKAWNPETPDVAGAVDRGLDAYFNTQVKEAQVNNLKLQADNMVAQNRLLNEQAKNVAAGTMEKLGMIDWRNLDMATKQFDLDSKKSLFPGQFEMQDWAIRHSIKDLDIKSQRHEMDLLKSAQSLEKGVVEIINLRLDSALKQLDAAYKRNQITQQAYDREKTKIEMAKDYATEQYIHEQRRHMETTNQFRHQWRSEDLGLKIADEFVDGLKLIKGGR